MRITYDATVDAAYIYLADSVYLPETRTVDHDINLDFNEDGQLVGVEVLDASKRLELQFLMPDIERIDVGWPRLKRELKRMKQGEPVETLDRRWKNKIVEVGDDYVVLRRERGRGRPITITKRQLEGTATEPYVLRALRKLGAYDGVEAPPK